MTSELYEEIQRIPLCDTHEHLAKEEDYVQRGPDLLQSLFGNYVPADLIVAGASPKAVENLLDASNPDIRSRFEGIADAWEAVQFTGYGEVVRIIARELYGLEAITPDALALQPVQEQHQALRQPGKRLAILRDLANLDHVQIDDFCWPCEPDPSGPEFFFTDISLESFCSGRPNVKQLAETTGIEVRDLGSLGRAMARIFERFAPVAIAVKSQHAYNRTLRWRQRPDGEAERALAVYLRASEAFHEEDRLCLGDWCWARGVELCIEYDLPFKIHTGYYAGHSRMPTDFIRSGHLCPLLASYPKARFVLMHMAYPYTDELAALAKHYPNVYADMCWGWGMNPHSASDFLRQCIHAVPANKVFVFGGDTGWPSGSLGYAQQMRVWLTKTLEAEIREGWLTRAEAIALARRFMLDNQHECFRVAAKREIARAQLAGEASTVSKRQ